MPSEVTAVNDSDIRNAFESIGPSPEAEKRMLENILEANTEHISAQTADASDAPRPRLAAAANPRQPQRTAAESASKQPRAPITKPHAHSSAPAHSKPVRKKRSPLAVALPIAACLIIVAIGVGVSTMAYITSLNSNLGGSADMAALSKSESQESPPDAAIEAIPYSESPTEEPNSPSILAALFPTIELADDSTLRVVFDDGSKPLVADIDLVGSERESATAHSDNAADESTVPCTVFEYADELHPYAIRYEGDPAYYLAASDS